MDKLILYRGRGCAVEPRFLSTFQPRQDDKHRIHERKWTVLNDMTKNVLCRGLSPGAGGNITGDCSLLSLPPWEGGQIR
jgi:hypothetical protein